MWVSYSLSYIPTLNIHWLFAGDFKSAVYGNLHVFKSSILRRLRYTLGVSALRIANLNVSIRYNMLKSLIYTLSVSFLRIANFLKFTIISCQIHTQYLHKSEQRDAFIFIPPTWLKNKYTPKEKLKCSERIDHFAFTTRSPFTLSSPYTHCSPNNVQRSLCVQSSEVQHPRWLTSSFPLCAFNIHSAFAHRVITLQVWRTVNMYNALKIRKYLYRI